MTVVSSQSNSDMDGSFDFYHNKNQSCFPITLSYILLPNSDVKYSVGKYCGDLIKSNAIKCDNKSDCFCKGEYCLAGGKCFYGDVFIRGKAIANTDWDMLDRHVICRQMGFWKAKGDTVTTTRLYSHP